MPFFMQLAFLMVGVAIVKAIDRTDYADALFTAALMVALQLALDGYMHWLRRRHARDLHARFLAMQASMAEEAKAQSAEKQP